jgi:hypothetical protein
MNQPLPPDNFAATSTKIWTVQDVADRLSGDVDARGVLAPKPGHSGKDRSLRVFVGDQFPDGYFVSSAHTVEGEDYRPLLVHVLNCCEFLPRRGVPAAPLTDEQRAVVAARRAESERKKAEESARKRAFWNERWKKAGLVRWQPPRVARGLPALPPPIQQYLEKRGVEIPPNVLRQTIFTKSKSQAIAYGMMVQIVSPSTDEAFAYHVTYITNDGFKTQWQGSDRITPGMRTEKGVGVIKLLKGSRLLAIGEGFETAMSFLRIPEAEGATIWAGINSDNMARLEPLDEFDAIMIAVDLEPSGAGRAAAETLAKSWHGAGKRVFLAIPIMPPGEQKFDLNDVARVEGGPIEGVHYMIEAYPEEQIGGREEEADEPAKEADKETGVSPDDFHAYRPLHNYIFMPTREFWPAASVNVSLGPLPLVGRDGEPLEGKNGVPKTIAANIWLDQNRAVEQMTWAPGLPTLIRDRLIAEGGWIERPGLTCLNLFRPPTIIAGDPTKAGPWIEHVRKVYPFDAEHLIGWFAYKVQWPGDKINHSLVLMGKPGIGKDTLLKPVEHAVGPWNFTEVSPTQVMGRFNGYAKSVIMRVSEGRDLGDVNRYTFYEHMKIYGAAPPDVIRVDEKNLREHPVLNCTGVIITTNHKTDGIYLPADDRRHYVASSDLTSENFPQEYWESLWAWYDEGGFQHVAAYLQTLDLSAFDPKTPPLKTEAFWNIVNANQPPEDGELADALDLLDNPPAVSISEIVRVAGGNSEKSSLVGFLTERKNSRAIPHRMEACGYAFIRNKDRKDGLWLIAGNRKVIYARSDLSVPAQHLAAKELVANCGRVRVKKEEALDPDIPF